MNDTAYPSDRHWLANALLTTPGALARARRDYHEYRGTDGALAARRVLDDALDGAVGWPRDDDYRFLADVFATTYGDLDTARLLNDAAAAGVLKADAADRWMLRYADRTETPCQEVTGWLSRRGYIDFDPQGPYRGIDGADYRPGYTTEKMREGPVVVVTSRGMTEFIAGRQNYEEMRRWVASRGSTGSGDLDPPSAAAGSRLIREERVLARLLTHQRAIPEIEGILPAIAFTADVRYDLYEAITTAARRGPVVLDSLLRRELTRRLAWVPDTEIAAYGGLDGGMADLYRSRLTDTVVSHDDALNAAWSLRDEDRQAVRARAYVGLAAQTAGPRPMAPERKLAAAPAQRRPSPDPGLAPRM